MKKLLLFILLTSISCDQSINKYEYVVKDETFRNNILKNNPGEYVQLSEGYTYFEEANSNSEIGNVVLVHGFSVPSYIMRTTFNSIKERGFRVIMMDLYGRGYSDNPNLPQTDELRAIQVIELMKSRGIKKASIVGLSNGGRIISKIADIDPELIKDLFYIASSSFYEYEEVYDKNVYQEEIDNMILKYPEMAKENGIQGKVFVQFVVWKDGTIKDVKVVKGVHKTLDGEAQRVVKSMPKWTPGKQRGTAVNARFTLPIKFRIS